VNLFGIGPGELLLILILALIVFGPRRLPEIGKSLGQMMREFRQASDEITGQLRQEIDAATEAPEAASDSSRQSAQDRDGTGASPAEPQE